MGRKPASKPRISYRIELLAAARLQQLAKLTSEKTGRNVDEGMIIEQLVNSIFNGQISLSILSQDELKNISQPIEQPQNPANKTT